MMESLRIACENCDWEFYPVKQKYSEVKKWHNKPCPKCGSIVIDDKDIKYARFIWTLAFISKVVDKIKRGKSNKVTIHIDSAKVKKTHI